MAKFDAVFVGLTILDIAGRPVSKIPEGGGVAFIEEIRMNPAGTAAGAVMNAAKLGAAAATVACLGADEMGDFILSVYQRLGIDCSLVQRTEQGEDLGDDSDHPAERRTAGAALSRRLGSLVRRGEGFRRRLRRALPSSRRDRLARGDGPRSERQAAPPRQEQGPDDHVRPDRARRKHARLADRPAALGGLFHALARGGDLSLRSHRSSRRGGSLYRQGRRRLRLQDGRAGIVHAHPRRRLPHPRLQGSGLRHNRLRRRLLRGLRRGPRGRP